MAEEQPTPTGKRRSGKIVVVVFCVLCALATGVVMLGGWAAGKEAEVQRAERAEIIETLARIAPTPDEAPDDWIMRLEQRLPPEYEVSRGDEETALILTPDFQRYAVALPEQFDLQEWTLEHLNAED